MDVKKHFYIPHIVNAFNAVQLPVSNYFTLVHEIETEVVLRSGKQLSVSLNFEADVRFKRIINHRIVNNTFSPSLCLQSFFGRTYNNLSSISECKNNGECVINKKNRTACKACRLRKCLLVGMSKSGSRYGRRSNWFKIHCLLQEQQQHQQHKNGHPAGITSHHTNSSPNGGLTNLDTGATGRNGSSGLFVDGTGMDKSMAKYLEHFGTNINAFRIRNNNNNNNCESKYNIYESDKRSEYAKRSSCSKSDEEESSHSSSIVVDEDSQPLPREESPLPLANSYDHLNPLLSHPNSTHGPIFRPGVDPISPFSQKYHDFFLSPFLHAATSLKRPLLADQVFDNRDQDTPIDLSVKSKISRISSSSSSSSSSSPLGVSNGICTSSGPDPDRSKSVQVVCEMEKKNPLDLSLLPARCNPIVG